MSAVNIPQDRFFIFLTKMRINKWESCRRMTRNSSDSDNCPGFLSLGSFCWSKQKNFYREDRILIYFMKTQNWSDSQEMERMFSGRLANYQVFAATSIHLLLHRRPSGISWFLNCDHLPLLPHEPGEVEFRNKAQMEKYYWGENRGKSSSCA